MHNRHKVHFLTPVVPVVLAQGFCICSGLSGVVTLDRFQFDSAITAGKQAYTMFQTSDGVTVIEGFQEIVNDFKQVPQAYNYKLAIKHYDSVVIMQAPDMNTGNANREVYVGRNGDTITSVCSQADNPSGGTNYRTVSCTITLTGGIQVSVSWLLYQFLNANTNLILALFNL